MLYKIANSRAEPSDIRSEAPTGYLVVRRSCSSAYRSVVEPFFPPSWFGVSRPGLSIILFRHEYIASFLLFLLASDLVESSFTTFAGLRMPAWVLPGLPSAFPLCFVLELYYLGIASSHPRYIYQHFTTLPNKAPSASSCL